MVSDAAVRGRPSNGGALDGGWRRRSAALGVAAALLLVAVVLGVGVGTIHLAPGAVVSTLLDRVGVHVGTPLEGVQAQILLVLRLPRVLLVALVGGVLAMAGAGYQGVFRNPLADPYLLGSAAGAGLGATLVIAYAPTGFGPIGTVPAAAFAGRARGRRAGATCSAPSPAGRRGTAPTLLLAGIAVSSFLTAIQTFVQQAHTDELRSVYSLDPRPARRLQLGRPRPGAPVRPVSVVVLLSSTRALDVLAVGDEEATTLGLHPQRVRLVVLAAASLATAAAVAVSGLIGFVGLVVPHIVRRLAGGSYRIVLPVSLVGGGAFLVLADLVARTVVAPGELPIGVVTAFVGAPFFAALLRLGGDRG